MGTGTGTSRDRVARFLRYAEAIANRQTYLLEEDPEHRGFYLVRDVPIFVSHTRGDATFTDADLDAIAVHHAELDRTGHRVPIFAGHHAYEGEEDRPKVGNLRNFRIGECEIVDPDTHLVRTFRAIFADMGHVKPLYARQMLDGDLEYRSVEVYPGTPRISGLALTSTVPPYFKFRNLVVELAEGVVAPAAGSDGREHFTPFTALAASRENGPLVLCYAERMGFTEKVASKTRIRGPRDHETWRSGEMFSGRRSARRYLDRADFEIKTWFERDRQHVELRDRRTGQTVVEWWDDDVSQAVEDGFLDPRDWLGSALDYAKHMGMVRASERRSARRYLQGYRWRVIEAQPGEWDVVVQGEVVASFASRPEAEAYARRYATESDAVDVLPLTERGMQRRQYAEWQIVDRDTEQVLETIVANDAEAARREAQRGGGIVEHIDELHRIIFLNISYREGSRKGTHRKTSRRRYCEAAFALGKHEKYDDRRLTAAYKAGKEFVVLSRGSRSDNEIREVIINYQRAVAELEAWGLLSPIPSDVEAFRRGVSDELGDNWFLAERTRMRRRYQDAAPLGRDEVVMVLECLGFADALARTDAIVKEGETVTLAQVAEAVGMTLGAVSDAADACKAEHAPPVAPGMAAMRERKARRYFDPLTLAEEWIRTDPHAVRQDVQRLGLEAAVEYELDLIVTGEDRRFDGVTPAAMRQALQDLMLSAKMTDHHPRRRYENPAKARCYAAQTVAEFRAEMAALPPGTKIFFATGGWLPAGQMSNLPDDEVESMLLRGGWNFSDCRPRRRYEEPAAGEPPKEGEEEPAEKSDLEKSLFDKIAVLEATLNELKSLAGQVEEDEEEEGGEKKKEEDTKTPPDEEKESPMAASESKVRAELDALKATVYADREKRVLAEISERLRRGSYAFVEADLPEIFSGCLLDEKAREKRYRAYVRTLAAAPGWEGVEDEGEEPTGVLAAYAHDPVKRDRAQAIAVAYRQDPFTQKIVSLESILKRQVPGGRWPRNGNKEK